MKPIVLNYKEDVELFNDTALAWAKEICGDGRECRVKSTQLRNFYEKVLELYEKSEKEDFSEVLPFVKMLNSKVSYALGRKHVSHEFETFMNQCVAQVQTKEQLKVFKLFFESVVGFYKGK
ncbi:MAG: type III-A CRISPR-associated protein Csm2 [Campylobacterota bacterium]|nr:type III-A CRISPR-associated protein Csm2 [Campylobacterota bacterium]